MTGKAVAVQGGLAALGLIAAQMTWQREPERAPGQVVVLDIGKRDLGNVHYEDETLALDLFRPADDAEGGVWMRLQNKVKPPAPGAADKGKDPSKPPAADVAKTKPPRELRGGEDAERIFNQFAPLYAPRGLGTLDAVKNKELGLDKTTMKLVVTARGEARELDIGKSAHGGGDGYLRDARDGRVYLMPRSLLFDLQGAATRLVDRRVHAFKIPEMDHLTITAGGKTRELVVVDRESSSGYKLAPPKAKDKPDDMARNWHEKIWHIYPQEQLGKGEKPAGGEPKPSVHVEYFDGGKKVGWMDIAKVDALAPATTESMSNPAAAKGEIYLRTEHTSGWIRVAPDQTLIADAEKIAAGG